MKEKLDYEALEQKIKILEARSIKDRQALAALKSKSSLSEKKFQAVIEQAAEEVVITDADGIIQYVNPAFEKNTGFSKNEVTGKNPRIIKSGFHDHEFYENLWQTILNKKTWKGKIINRARDGRQIIHDVTITSILDSDGDITSFVSVRRDITREEKTEKQIQQTRKMEAIGTLAGGIAHDFNNILAGVMGYTELVIEDIEDSNCSPKTRERLDNIMISANRAKDLVGQILTFSRADNEDRHPVNIKLLVKEVTSLLRASLPSTIEISLSLMSDSYVMANPGNIHQIFMNICVNAKDAMEKTGGILSVSMTDVIVDEKDLAGNENIEPGKFVLTSVADTGKGMTNDITAKMMEPFFTTKAKGRGIGMGLFVVHGIVKSLGGFITTVSKLNAGSMVDVYLPVCPNIKDEANHQEDKETARGDESILFVDDEHVLCEVYKDLLSEFGYKVTVFEKSREALKVFRQNPDQFDLAILDITMPEMTGDVLAQKMRFIRPDLPVVLCTGAGDRLDRQAAENNNMNALLYKPVSAKKFAITLRDVFQGKSVWPES